MLHTPIVNCTAPFPHFCSKSQATLRAYTIRLQLRIVNKINVGCGREMVAAVSGMCWNEIEALVQRTASPMLSVAIADQPFSWELAMSFT
jgi:hypothetical protein